MPDAADKVALQGTASFALGATFVLSTSHVRLSRCVGALLSQGDEIQQHVEAAVPSTVETVLHPACTGGLDGCDAGQYSDLRYAEARARQTELGDQPGGYDRLDAGDVQQRKEVLTNAGLDIGAELAFLIDEQPDLLGNLAHRLFADPIQRADPRCRIRSRGLDANPTPQRTNDVFVFRIAEQQERMQPVPQTSHIQHEIVAEAAPELEAGSSHRLGLDQRQAFAFLAQQACNRLCIEHIALARSTQSTPTLGGPAWIDFVHLLATTG